MGAAFCSRLGSRASALLLGAAAEALLLGAQPRLGEQRLPAYGSISLALPAALAQSGLECALAHLPSVRGTFFFFCGFVADPRASEGPGRGIGRGRGAKSFGLELSAVADLNCHAAATRDPAGCA